MVILRKLAIGILVFSPFAQVGQAGSLSAGPLTIPIACATVGSLAGAIASAFDSDAEGLSNKGEALVTGAATGAAFGAAAASAADVISMKGLSSVGTTAKGVSLFGAVALYCGVPAGGAYYLVKNGITGRTKKPTTENPGSTSKSIQSATSAE